MWNSRSASLVECVPLVRLTSWLLRGLTAKGFDQKQATVGLTSRSLRGSLP